MPYYPSEDDSDNTAYYEITSIREKVVSDYTKLSFAEIEELPIDVYMLFLRDGYIYKLQQTEKGREYLEKCWMLSQTKPDRKALRKRFGKGR